jgi:predicted ATP-dependent serine protease
MLKYAGLSKEQRRTQYDLDRELISKARKTQVNFVGSELKLRMGVTVLGGCTGRGKSTTSANVLAHFYSSYPDRQAVVITNEEVSADVLDRVSCVLLDLNFYKYRDGFLRQEDEDLIKNKSVQLMERIEVVCTTAVDMTCIDDVVEVLQYAKNKDNVHLVVFDYLQTVTWSRCYEDASRYEISKKLGLFLKQYGRTVNIPVLVFAQLQPTGSSNTDFASRIQGDKTFVNHAVMAIEIRPDFAKKQTVFYVDKDRFGEMQGNSLTFSWNYGKLIRQKSLVEVL